MGEWVGGWMSGGCTKQLTTACSVRTRCLGSKRNVYVGKWVGATARCAPGNADEMTVRNSIAS